MKEIMKQVVKEESEVGIKSKRGEVTEKITGAKNSNNFA